MRSKADIVGLIYRTETTTKNCKTEKLKSKSRYVRSNSKSLGNHLVSSEKEKERLQWEGFAEKGSESGMKERKDDGKLILPLQSFNLLPRDTVCLHFTASCTTGCRNTTGCRGPTTGWVNYANESSQAALERSSQDAYDVTRKAAAWTVLTMWRV